MLLKKAVEKKQEAPETNPYEWPESYYMETDAHQRKALLEAHISSGDAGVDNRLRKELWELRYQTQKKGAERVEGGGQQRDGHELHAAAEGEGAEYGVSGDRQRQRNCHPCE